MDGDGCAVQLPYVLIKVSASNPPKGLMLKHFCPAFFCVLEWAIGGLLRDAVFFTIPTELRRF